MFVFKDMFLKVLALVEMLSVSLSMVFSIMHSHYANN